jgi:hypothetical protein
MHVRRELGAATGAEEYQRRDPACLPPRLRVALPSTASPPWRCSTPTSSRLRCARPPSQLCRTSATATTPHTSGLTAHQIRAAQDLHQCAAAEPRHHELDPRHGAARACPVLRAPASRRTQARRPVCVYRQAEHHLQREWRRLQHRWRRRERSPGAEEEHGRSCRAGERPGAAHT